MSQKNQNLAQRAVKPTSMKSKTEMQAQISEKNLGASKNTRASRGELQRKMQNAVGEVDRISHLKQVYVPKTVAKDVAVCSLDPYAYEHDLLAQKKSGSMPTPVSNVN